MYRVLKEYKHREVKLQNCTMAEVGKDIYRSSAATHVLKAWPDSVN